MLVFLIEKGNFVNIFDRNKRTPLFLAAKNNQFETCQILLEKQANPLLENKDGLKPIDVVSNINVKKLITEYMEVKINKINKYQF
jgi:ankyrin repeat protein